MKKHNFITVKEFCIRHGLNRCNVYVRHSNGAIPTNTLIFSNRSTLIDEAYFLRRDKFARDVYLEAQNNFSDIYDFIPNNSAIARLIIALGGTRSINMYTQFIFDSLFVNKPYSLLSNKLYFGIWEFWRITRWLVKIIRHLNSYDEYEILRYIKSRNQ